MKYSGHEATRSSTAPYDPYRKSRMIKGSLSGPLLVSCLCGVQAIDAQQGKTGTRFQQASCCYVPKSFQHVPTLIGKF